ncbi:N-acetylmuramoyl-L-alanine amidase [Mucilaginibacter sp. RB4R14]|uniref:N-acetylmuramoyl-L-alanine amidase family protein n=1 Tax=Mucilaginibacter aurantiaciroseus TaxID=2949308 RepID=UPI00209199AE|nr:N-acetylmuramoyl-L-alanine amidase [Mucilaginibacter aurantiaciroseus]MCO5934562.1 N-acetylmuramoyl-L-alanine amidase [Mucilaginibacter aurantiaciroseus]
MIKKSIGPIISVSILCFYLLLCSFSPAADTIRATGFKLKTVIIDAGHGGKDAGAKGLTSFEKNVTLSIAQKLQDAIKAQIPDLSTVMTRFDDTFIELRRRSDIANKSQGNLFVSIHCNSSAEGTAYRAHKQSGVMLLVYASKRTGEQLEAVRENASILIEKDPTKYEALDAADPANAIILDAFTKKYRKQSIRFGEFLNQEFTETDGRPSIGVREQSLYVLANSGMPAVLVETGFINNPEEEIFLNSDEGQAQIVQTIIRSIMAYRAAQMAQ